MTYTIKQFAELFHTSEHTIRYYTDIELLPCRRDKGNRRVFDEESVNWMQGITCPSPRRTYRLATRSSSASGSGHINAWRKPKPRWTI